MAFFLFPLLWLLHFIIPFVFKAIINRSLGKLEGYRGRLSGLRITLFPAAFVIHNFRLYRRNNGEAPVVSVERLRLKFELPALLKKMFVCELRAEEPVIHIEKEYSQVDKGAQHNSANDVVIEMPVIPFPVLIHRLLVDRGRLVFTDPATKPPVNVELDDIDVRGCNFATEPIENLLPAEMEVHSNLYGGRMRVRLRATLFEKQPAIDMDMEMREMDMVRMNDLLSAYGNFDVNAGTLGLFAEVAVQGNKFKGYVKPLIRNLKVLGREDKHDSFFHKVWEGLVGVVAELFQNQGKDQVGSKIPFEGTLSSPEVKIGPAVLEVLRNAFVVALKPRIDQEIGLGTLRKGR